MARDYDFSTPPCLRSGCNHSFINHTFITENGCWPVLGPCDWPSDAFERKKDPKKCECKRFVHETSYYTTGEPPMKRPLPKDWRDEDSTFLSPT